MANLQSAQECAPKTCQCGKRLPKPHYHKRDLCFIKGPRYMKWYCKACDEPVLERDDVWAITCTHCHTFYQWCYPNVWKITSTMPLFNTKTEITNG